MINSSLILSFETKLMFLKGLVTKHSIIFLLFSISLNNFSSVDILLINVDIESSFSLSILCSWRKPGVYRDISVSAMGFGASEERREASVRLLSGRTAAETTTFRKVGNKGLRIRFSPNLRISGKAETGRCIFGNPACGKRNGTNWSKRQRR